MGDGAMKNGDNVISPNHDRGQVVAVEHSGRGWRRSTCVTVRFADGSIGHYPPENLIPVVPPQLRPRIVVSN